MASISSSPLFKHESGHHPPPAPAPLASAPSQEDLWHLPGRLRINPSLWDKEDVAHWLHWAQKEYSLRRPEKGHFEMNGRALCLLTKEDFRCRCPSSGDVLYEILQCVKQQRRSVVYEAPCASPSVSAGHIQGPLSNQMSSHTVTEPNSDTPVSPTVSIAASAVSFQHEPMPPFREHPVFYHYSAPLTHNNGSPSVSSSPHNPTQYLPLKERVIQEPLNLSSREKPRSPLHKANGRIPECRLLWDYVYQLLCDERYQDYIRWEDPDSHVFRVVDPNGLARLWGNHKNRDNMTYEKMSRALRHYYKLNVIKKERGQRLLFRFLKLPQDIKKHHLDTAESPERSPPQDGDFPDSSPTYDFSSGQFEVSPDRPSPQPSPPTRASVG
ncbi:transcription factor ETV7 isoform X2 [Nothobranchius furzeri]|uniref:Transcription factor ETV6 n=3 Tax=Nothobranchius TaxID=28779 RepID=A0A9D3BHA0_NOTFU|nr:transcription factor ETV7 isoform X2 [Nothobranchius furzeri]KAF7209917.1 transcript variant X2 [Nothobranchius furzeri]